MTPTSPADLRGPHVAISRHFKVFEAAYARRLLECMAIEATDGVSGLDVEQAVVTIRGAMPDIDALRGEMAARACIEGYPGPNLLA
jgi:hypothetical protein